MRKWIWLLCAVMLLGGCAGIAAEELPGRYEAGAVEAAKALVNKDYEAVRTLFHSSLSKQLDEATLREGWDGVVYGLGEADKEQAYTTELQQNSAIVTVRFAQGVAMIRTSWDKNARMTGLNVNVAPLPEDIAQQTPFGREVQVTVDAGTGYPLQGVLTLPEGEGPFDALVLVQGSGATDRNEQIGPNMPFRDIAWGLAQRGIASLRYDKRTFAHPNCAQDANTFTVKEEFIDDAVAAVALLRNRDDIGKIFLAGHSQGAMMAPRIQQAAQCDGVILMAGTPKQLWEVSLQQNLDLIEKMSETEKKVAMLQIDGLKKQAEKLPEMTEAEAKKTTIFGLPGYYAWEMAQYDMAKLAREMGPTLLLQGEKDFQVNMKLGLDAWREAGVVGEYHEYEGLNHIFMTSKGPYMGTVQEYYAPAKVDEQVIEDIALWMKAQR